MKGLSTGDSSEALEAILGPDAPNPSPTTIRRPKAVREAEPEGWSERSPAAKHHVCAWADGMHSPIRLEEGRRCILVLSGAAADGKKELIAIADGYRESEQSRKASLLDCKARGLEVEPHPAIGGGALGFWKAMRQLWETTKDQRCSVHETANGLDKLPEGSQPKAERVLHEIDQAEGRAPSEEAFDRFVATYEAKSPEAPECLSKDRDVLPTSYDFPAAHWLHIRTTNPIESTFSTVRLRHTETKGSGSRTACLTTVYEPMETASKKWRALNGSTPRPEVIKGTGFGDGVKHEEPAA